MLRSERGRNLALRMRALGVPIDLAEFEELLTVRQDSGPLLNSMASHYLSRDRIGLTVQTYISIVSNSTTSLSLCSFEVCLPWTDTPVQLAEPVAPTYRFPSSSSYEFDKSKIIVQSGKTLKRGQSIEGFLLGFHDDPIPPSFCHGTEVPIVLTLEDQFGEIYSRELFLKVDRTAESRPKPKTFRSRPSLFARPYSPKTGTHTEGKMTEPAAASYEKSDREVRS